MNSTQDFYSLYCEIGRKTRGIARFTVAKEELIESLQEELQSYDRCIILKKKKAKNTKNLNDKLALLQEIYLMETKRDFLRLTAFEREDIITDYFDERLKNLKENI
jgi:hypothetical protein